MTSLCHLGPRAKEGDERPRKESNQAEHAYASSRSAYGILARHTRPATEDRAGYSSHQRTDRPPDGGTGRFFFFLGGKGFASREKVRRLHGNLFAETVSPEISHF
jgi:hypothetical protein